MRCEVFEDDTFPERMIRNSAEVGEGFFRSARNAFDFGEEVTELNEKPAETLTLVLREGHDARDVVPLSGTVLFFAKVTD